MSKTSESFNRGLKGQGWAQPLEHFANLDLLNAWIVHFGTWKRLISKAVTVKTDGDSKLFCLTLRGLGGLHVLLLACLVNFSTVLNCRGWNCMWGCRVFFQFLKSGGQKKVRLWNLGKKWGLGVGDRVGGQTHFFSLNVILRTFVYLIYVCFA